MMIGASLNPHNVPSSDAAGRWYTSLEELMTYTIEMYPAPVEEFLRPVG
jgi:hypothetical protein